ncbi:MAG: hypothetical protein NTW19_05000 [Planctomycetota bacterium]|nr:hypothetical protein [Planctomycetota bacterium]
MPQHARRSALDLLRRPAGRLFVSALICAGAAASATTFFAIARADEPVAATTAAPSATAPATTSPATATSAPTVSPEASAWLDKIEAKAATIRTLECKLRYDRTQGLLKDTQARFGSLTYRTGPVPGFAVHFDRLYVDGRNERSNRWYIYDGTWLVEKLEDQKQFFKRQIVPPDAPADRRDPLALGEGPFAVPVTMNKQRVLRRYQVELVPPVALPASADPAKGELANSVHIRMVPHDQDSASFQEIDIWYDRESLLPVKVRSLNDSKTESVIQLREPQVNQPIESGVFDTSLPKGEGWRTEVTPWEKGH